METKVLDATNMSVFADETFDVVLNIYVFQYIAMRNDYFLDEKLAKQLTETGVLRHDDDKCFWTDTYYSTKEEMKICINYME